MKSYIYTGQVRHRRFAPKPHQFEYRLFMLYIDLAELPGLFKKRWLWSAQRFALARFKREDHFGDNNSSLELTIKQLVEKETGSAPAGPIRLLTHLRYFGYCFNPVSFYYCFDADDEFVETIVAEVNNTPWGERHCYVLSDKTNLGKGHSKRYQFGKDFHVSPFMPAAINYDWRFTQPGKYLAVHMENLDASASDNQKIFDATMVLQRKTINTFSLATTLLNFPFMTGKVISAIYWQAFKMWLKGFPFFAHPQQQHDHLNSQPTVEKL